MGIIDKIRIINRKIKIAHGYQLLHDGVKESAVLNIEGVCPVCGNSHVSYIDTQEYYNKHQYMFFCSKCNSKWQGNRYNRKFEWV